VGDAQLSHDRFAPSESASAVLAFRAGWIAPRAGGDTIEPVGILDLELLTAAGRPLGVLARQRNLLPGRYAFGLTGRGPDGRPLRPGRYVLRLAARPVDAEDGEEAATVDVPFTVEARAK
jgi:hypothetical protein